MGNTPHFGWAYPVVGGSNDVWGDVLNLLFIAVDQELWALNPPVTGTIDNMVIGSVVPKAGTFASLQSLGNFGVNGDMQVNGNTTLNGNASVGGSLSVFSDFSVTGTANFSGPFNATGIMQLGAVGVPGELRFKRASDGIAASRIFELPDASGTGLGLEAGGNSPMVFYVGGTGLGANPERMRIDAAGNVGIGTTAPASFYNDGALVVAGQNNGSIIISGPNGGDPALYFRRTDTPGVERGYIQYDTTAEWMRFATNGGERMRLDANGNVGIGTVAPAARLHVAYPGDNSSIALFSGVTKAVRLGASAATASIDGVDNTGNASFQPLAISASALSLFSVLAQPMTFSTNGGERMRIDAAGNVGIGLTNPLAQLDVRQSASIRSGAGQTAYLDFSGDSAGYQTESFTVGQAGDKSALLYQRANTSMLFATNAAERMRIDAAGNVGIGMVPSNILDVTLNQNAGSSIKISNNSAGSAAYAQTLASNSNYQFGMRVFGSGYGNSGVFSPNYACLFTDALAMSIVTTQAVPILFGTNNTERMRIDAAGNVTPGADGTQTFGSSARRWNTVYAEALADGGDYLVSSAGTTARFALGPGWTANAFYTNGTERMRIDANGTVTVQNPADNNYFLFSGSSKALRVSTSSATTFLHGTDATGSASYQPLTIGGLFLSLGTNFGEMIRIDPGLVSVNNSTDQLKALAINGTVNTLRLGTDTNFASVQGTDVGGSQWRPIALGGSRVTFQVAGVEVGTFTPSNYFKASSTGGYPYGSSLIHEFNTAKDGQEALIVSHNFVANPYGLMIVFGGTLNNAANYFLRFQDPSGAKGYFMSNGGLWNTQANNANMSDENMKDYITPYNDKELDGLQASFCDVIWGKYKFKDQTHTDWNHGPTAQGVERAFALTAPELVDESDPALDKDTAPHTKHKGIYETDLAHIAHALLARALKEIAELKATVALLLGGKPVAA